MTDETICILRNGSGFDFNRYVQRTFRDAETAHKYVNNLDRNVMLVSIPGRWKAGAAVPLTTRTRSLS
jgi:hypothetical protein